MKRNYSLLFTLMLLTLVATLLPTTGLAQDDQLFGAANGAKNNSGGVKAKNVIFFLGDGMGVSTVTATRVYSVGVDGKLTIDTIPYTALSRTSSADHITPDSAATMTAMMTGVNANSGVIGFPADTEFDDFNSDGDGSRLWTMAELAKRRGMKVGVVSTARITHATPAAVYSHVNNRNDENDIALQALPTDATYNSRLGNGLDIIMGGGRRYFVPSGTNDEEGEGGSRGDGRDLRTEYQAAGYTYVYEETAFNGLGVSDLPILGLFDRSHMEYEYDRPTDLLGEPSLADMTRKSVELLEQATKRGPSKGYFLMVESGRIDHAHHEGNAYRNIIDTEEFDEAIAAAIKTVNLKETLIVVTADHSHVYTIAGYPMRPRGDLQYTPISADPDYLASPNNNITDIVFDISGGAITPSTDSNGVPYTVLSYANGGGYRGPGARVNPQTDTFGGWDGSVPSGPNDPEYLQEATVPKGFGGETHSGEEVAMYAVGPNASKVRGTIFNRDIFNIMKDALGL